MARNSGAGEGGDRQSVILDAVIGLLADGGLAGVTHRAADAAAGLPQGSSSYYFPRKSALLRAAASHLAAERERDCDDLQIAFAGAAARRGLEAAIGAPPAGSWPRRVGAGGSCSRASNSPWPRRATTRWPT